MADENSPSGDPAASGGSIGRPVSEPGPHVPADPGKGETATFDKQALLQSSYTPKIDGYTVAREISRGGQAVVYRARQHSTGQHVAVKVMLDGPYAGPAQRARFDREVQILAALEHTHIVSVVDRGVTPEGAFYLIMEYVEGCSLDEHLAKGSPAAKGPEQVKTALRLFMAICDTVNAAHLRGVVHRDLKPSNIRIDSRGEPWILDFGLARTALPGYADADSESPVTITGQFLGSLPWASPEQAEGLPALIDTRTDVYSLGVILYYMLTGEFPYKVVGSMRKVLANITQTQPSPPSEVIAARDEKKAGPHRRRSRTHLLPFSPALDAVVLKALAKKREDRYESAGDLSRDIANVLAGRPTVAGGAAPKRRGAKIALLAGGGIAFLAVAVALVVYLAQPRSEKVTPARQTPQAGGPAGDSPPVPEVPGWPFDAVEARRRQQAAAQAYGVPVEKTLALGKGVTMDLVLVPPGSFRMGEPKPAGGWHQNEGPAHQVTLTKPFYLGVHEVTRAQFARFVEQTGHRTDAETAGGASVWRGKWERDPGRLWRTPTYSQGEDHPVVCVSWQDAAAFCRWLSRKADGQVRLPTEAEWEYASRAGTQTAFCFGDQADLLHKYANYCDRYCSLRLDWKDDKHDDGHDKTAPAGSGGPNAWGLHDMHGNVWEWCADWYADRYPSPAASTDPRGPGPGRDRVLRGGSWYQRPSFCRSAVRNRFAPDGQWYDLGFRVAMTAKDE